MKSLAKGITDPRTIELLIHSSQFKSRNLQLTLISNITSCAKFLIDLLCSIDLALLLLIQLLANFK